MGKESSIQWTQVTWNPGVGCVKVDEDCKFCYMYRESLNGTRYDPKTVRRTTTVFNLPLRIKEPSLIFTASLTDIFIENIDPFRNEIWDIIRKCPQHIFQILTKRPERITDCLPPDWGSGWKNVWLGTSVGSNESANRIEILLRVPSLTRFASLEPLHFPVNLDNALWIYGDSIRAPRIGWNHFDKNKNTGLDWVIVGGESGNENGKYRYRPCRLEWIEDIIFQCKENNIPVFVKQLGTHLAKELQLKDRHGGEISEWPLHLQIREFPKSK
jgi:protein gp37